MRTTSFEQLHQPDTLDRHYPGQAPSTETLERVYFGDDEPLDPVDITQITGDHRDFLNPNVPAPREEVAPGVYESSVETWAGDRNVVDVPSGTPLIGTYDPRSIDEMPTPIFNQLEDEYAVLRDPKGAAKALGIVPDETALLPVARTREKTMPKLLPFNGVPVAPGQTAVVYEFTGRQPATGGKVPTPRDLTDLHRAPEVTLSLEDVRASRQFTAAPEDPAELRGIEARLDGRQEPLYGLEKEQPEAVNPFEKLHQTVSNTAQLDGMPPEQADAKADEFIALVTGARNVPRSPRTEVATPVPTAPERRRLRERLSPRRAIAIGTAALALTAGIMVGTATPAGEAPARSAATISVETPTRANPIEAHIAAKPEATKPKVQEVTQPKVVEAEKQEEVMQVKLPAYNAETQAGTPWKAAADMLREAGDKDPSRREIRALTNLLLKNAGVTAAHADELHRGAMLQAARDQVRRIIEDEENTNA